MTEKIHWPENPTDGDVYRWKWSDAVAEGRKKGPFSGSYLYHCKSQIAIVRGEYLIDTFWNDQSTERAIHKDSCELTEYLGNLNDYEQRSYRGDTFKGYDKADILDLRHGNDSSAIFLRKGAKRSYERTLAAARQKLSDAHKAAESAQRDIENCARRLAELEATKDPSGYPI